MSQNKPIVKEYTNGEITVVWQPSKCIHSALCVEGLPAVFDQKVKPWINANGASSQQMMDQIKKCPSGALSFYRNADRKQEQNDLEAGRVVEVIQNGPLLVYGNLSVKHSDGSVTNQTRTTAFCRCGGSGKKPFCDGTHQKIGFKG